MANRPRSYATRNLLAMLAVCLAASLPYLSTVHNYFVADDFGVVQLLSQKPAWHFPRWFTTSWMDDIWGFTPDEIRPFPALSFQLTALWGAASPVANHVLNIAIHAANGLLVLAVARTAAGVSLIAATFAALVFVVLPIQAESVAWITGRVDTIPAFFYIGSFLAYVRWRAAGSNSSRLYLSSVVLFFLALFSKQNTMTMVATLALYDVLVERRAGRLSWPSLRPYVPYVALTGGYLGLRYALFGEVARESQLTAQGLEYFGYLVERHLRRLVFGGVAAGSPLEWAAALVAAGSVWLVALRSGAGNLRRAAAVALYFGPVWWLLGVAPIAVAGYESPRHVYLASLGWAILLGLGFQVLWHARPYRVWRSAAVVTGAGLLVTYTLQLHGAVAEWNTAASVSKKAVADLEREALAAPEGSLLIVGAPVKSWEWAVPFVAQPPFTRTDLSTRVFIVSPWLLHCCRAQWSEYTRRTLQTWSERSDRPPVVALHWNARTGAASRLTDREYPALRDLVMILLETDTLEALNKTLLDILNQLVSAPPG